MKNSVPQKWNSGTTKQSKTSKTKHFIQGQIKGAIPPKIENSGGKGKGGQWRASNQVFHDALFDTIKAWLARCLLLRMEKLESVQKEMSAWYQVETTRQLLWGRILAVNRLGKLSRTNAYHLHHQDCRLNMHVLCQATEDVSAVFPPHTANASGTQQAPKVAITLTALSQ